MVLVSELGALPLRFPLADVFVMSVDLEPFQLLTERMTGEILMDRHPEPDSSFRLENPRECCTGAFCLAKSDCCP